MLEQLRVKLRSYINPEKAAFFPRFFKTGSGQYGEGDVFMGVTVPNCRLVAKEFDTLALDDLEKLLESNLHEERLVALLTLVRQYIKKDASPSTQKQIYEFYLSRTDRVNNWDLVDLSSRDIVGHHIYDHPDQLPTLDKLALSPLLWDRRIAIIATFYFLQKGNPEPTLRIVKALLSDDHDLIQKASGWMLREMGKRIDRQLLVDFIRDNYTNMPRTTLRYAIEHFSQTERKRFLHGDFAR